MKNFIKKIGECMIGIMTSIHHNIKNIDDYSKVFIILILWEILFFILLFKTTMETAVIFILGSTIIGILVYFDNKVEIYKTDVLRKRNMLGQLSNQYQNEILKNQNINDIINFPILVASDPAHSHTYIIRTDQKDSITKTKQKEILKFLNLTDENTSFHTRNEADIIIKYLIGRF